MKLRLRTAFVVAMVAGGLAAQPITAAVEVAVSVSPATGIVDRPVEVLVRTFIPIGRDGIDLPPPSLAYPAPSGLWNVLYPIDYPFDVIAQSPTGEELKVELVRDATDASLWRGSFTPTIPGEWSIVLRNFPTQAATRIIVAAAQESGTGIWGVAIAALLLGLVGGLLLGRAVRRSSSRDGNGT